MNEKILVVDDEKEIADLLEVYLKNENYDVHKCYAGNEALECVRNTPFDLAVLDVMLPDMDGFSLCQTMNQTIRPNDIHIISYYAIPILASILLLTFPIITLYSLA